MIMTSTGRTLDRMILASELTAAYVSRNHVPIAELPALIMSIRAALDQLSSGQVVQPAEHEGSMATAAQIRKSITHDALVSFIDGKPYSMLRRHLTTHGLTPDSYRAQYGLPSDYPMVAPSYSEKRSTLAKGLGLGSNLRRRRKAE